MTSTTRQCSIFFQADDGIRAYKVTGVQTCALPISAPRHAAPDRRLPRQPLGLLFPHRQGRPVHGPPPLLGDLPGRQGGVVHRHRAPARAAARRTTAASGREMSVVRVGIAGAGGRMGHALLEAACATEGIAVGSAVDLAPGAWGHVAIGTDVSAAIGACDVLIDFTRPAGTLEHVRACVAAKRAIVIGTTGFSSAQVEEIQRAAAAIAVVMAPNMSVGVNVMLKLVELGSRALGPAYDVEVFEMHHRKKVDAPSGTALKLGEVAAAARGAER